MNYFWLSFCDTNKPAGTQFLGAAITRGDTFAEAIREAWRAGCNPGGQVAFVEMTATSSMDFTEEDVGRLFSADEIERRWGAVSLEELA